MTRTRLKYMGHTSGAAGHVKSYLFNNGRLMALTAVLLFGFLCGTLITKNISSGRLNSLTEIFNRYIEARSSRGFVSNFFNTMLSSIVFPLISVLFGLSAIGFPIVAAVPFFQGLGLGMTAAYIYSAYGLHGIGYCLLIFFPYNIISSATLLYFCKEGIAMSYGIFSAGRGASKSFDLQQEMKMYCARIAVFSMFLVVASTVSAFSALAFGRFFEF